MGERSGKKKGKKNWHSESAFGKGGTSSASFHPEKHRLFTLPVGTGLPPPSSPHKKDHLHHLPLSYWGKKSLGEGTRALVELFFHGNKRESGGRKPSSPVPREGTFYSCNCREGE